MSDRTSYIDTHTHLDQILKRHKLAVSDFPSFRESTLLNVPTVADVKAEYDGCVHICCDVDAFDASTELAQTHDDVWGSFGIHPHNAKDYTDEIETRLVQLMAHPKTVAWGECGLDYHYNLSDPAVQRAVFERQITHAVACGKPLVIHTREAEDDTFRLLSEHVPRDHLLHIHCFTSSLAFAERILANFPNAHIGFTGVITFKGVDELRQVVARVPLDRILLETDGPYMTPVPFRGKICNSSHIPYTAQCVAQCKSVSLTEVFRVTRDNARRVYGI